MVIAGALIVVAELLSALAALEVLGATSKKLVALGFCHASAIIDHLPLVPRVKL